MVKNMRKLAIRIRWCEIKKFLLQRKFSSLHLILFFVMMVSFVFMSTAIFGNLADILKLGYYGVGVLSGWVLGISGTRQLERFLENTKNILFRKDIPFTTKYNRIVGAIRQGCWMLGKVFEEWKLEQGFIQEEKND